MVLVFEERGKSEYPAKNPRSKDENQQQTRPAEFELSGSSSYEIAKIKLREISENQR